MLYFSIMSMQSLIGSSVVISGPTAIGKTAIAIEMVRERPEKFEILSADSIQAYRRFDIGSAKPTTEERAESHFHLIDVVDPDGDFTVVDFLALAHEALAGIFERNRIPLIVGGAGLYIRALTDGIGIPNAGPDIDLRKALLGEAAAVGTPELHKQLALIDQDSAAKIHPNDLKRIIRALEVFKLTGRPLSSWHQEDQKREKVAPRFYFALDRDRDKLYAQIDQRVDDMFRKGLVEEVKQLRADGYGADLKPMTSVGYFQANKIIDGQLTVCDGIELAKTATHQYARRQLIWFRREPVDNWINLEGCTEIDVATKILEKIEKKNGSLS